MVSPTEPAKDALRATRNQFMVEYPGVSALPVLALRHHRHSPNRRRRWL